MNDAVTGAGAAQGAATETTTVSLLDEAIGATRQTEPDRAKDLLKALTQEALKRSVTLDKNVAKTITQLIAQIDEQMSAQLAKVMHHADFQKLEGSWRGLHYMVMNSETSAQLKLKVLNVSKRELGRDLSRASEFDQSELFKKIYENEFGIAGGEPYGALVGDYEFSNHPEDMELLQKVSNVSAAAFAPFISAASPKLFGFDSFTEMPRVRDMEKIFESVEYAKWRGFRDSEDSRFVTLTIPRVLARVPYGSATKTVEAFAYEEAPIKDGRTQPMPHDSFCWMNAAYVMATRLTDAFSKYN